ncbi:MAG TPA: DMT family transporter [Marmoricola sp.]|nr:DMT family transporter [Marmoricola sp.]
MSMEAVVILLGLLASFLFALAAYFQQRAARETEREGRTVVDGLYALMRKLVRDRTWLTGWMVNLGGFATQAAALHLGSVAVVQPLLATQLMFAMPMSSLERKSWPRWRDWASALAICGGLVLLLVVVDAAPLKGNPDRTKIIVAVAIALGVIAVVVPVASRLEHEVMNVATAACAGLCFSMTGVFLKLTSDDLADHGIAYTATDWVGYALAGSTLLGLVLEQAAFANGPLPWAIATKDSTNPIASYAIGVLAFPVAFPSGAGALVGIAGAGVLLILGAIGLAHSPSADLWLQRKEDTTTTRMR